MPILKCDHCGSKYQKQGGSMLTQVLGDTGVLFNAWIPEGWGYAAESDVRWISQIETTTHNLYAQSNEASLYFFPRAYFKESNRRGYGLQMLTFQNDHIYLKIDEYIPQRLLETFPGSAIKQVEFVDKEPFESIAGQFMPQAAQYVQNPEAEYGMYKFCLENGGREFYGYMGTVLMHSGTGQPVQQKMDLNFFLRGGIIGAQLHNMNKNWARERDVILLTTNPNLKLYEDIFRIFAANIQYGPGYALSQQRERELTNQIMIQGAMQRQQNQIAASRQLSNTISQRSNMIMDTWNNRQAAQTRMSNNFSEAIRGVNSYTSTTGQKIEASVRYDHVYQNGNDYIGRESNLDLGSDWTELTRNK